MKRTVYYVIVDEKGRMLLQDCKLPIYWNKRVAEKRVELFPGFHVATFRADEFHKILK